MSQKDVDWRCPSGNHHSHCNWAIYALLLLWYWYGYIVPDKTRPTKLPIDLKDSIRHSQRECCPISTPPNNVYKVRTTSLVCVRVTSGILEAAHGEACKTQMFLASWKRHLIVLIKSTVPFSTESTESTKSIVLEQSTTGDTPGSLTHRHFPELPICFKLSVTLAMNVHTPIVDFFHSHSCFWIFALQCIIFDKKFPECIFQWMNPAASVFTREQRISVTKNWSRHPMHHIEAVALHLLKWIKKPGMKLRRTNNSKLKFKASSHYFGHIFCRSLQILRTSLIPNLRSSRNIWVRDILSTNSSHLEAGPMGYL